jgi:2-polyprenyl-3-methyl-5-hydroxy-6-metoxy-1,4-benzoquinol methylase
MNNSKPIVPKVSMWDNRYLEPGFAYGTTPNQFLTAVAKDIPKGKVLCMGAGEGRNAVYLAQQGYDVTALDISRVGLEKAQMLAHENKVTINVICTDIQDFTFVPASWQGIISIFLHLPPALRKKTHAKISTGLFPGGVFILEGYSKQQLNYKTGGPPVEELLYDLPELTSELVGLQLKIKTHTVRPVIEGKYHHGEGSVIQISGYKPI